MCIDGSVAEVLFCLVHGSVLGFLVKDWSLCGLLKAEIG